MVSAKSVELADVEINPPHRVGSWLFLEMSTTSASMMPALPTMPRPGSMMVSGMLVAEVLAQRAEDRLAVALHGRDVFQVLGRKSAAEVDHLKHDAALGQVLEDGIEAEAKAHRPTSVGLLLLRADVERQAIGL